jgi:hypothetical protein
MSMSLPSEECCSFAATLCSMDLRLHCLARSSTTNLGYPAILELLVGSDPSSRTRRLAELFLGLQGDQADLRCLGRLAVLAPETSGLWVRVAARNLGRPTPTHADVVLIRAFLDGAVEVDITCRKAMRSRLQRHREGVVGECRLGLFVAMRREYKTNELARRGRRPIKAPLDLPSDLCL